MGVIAKYKFNNTLEANLLPEFNSEFTSDLYTVTDEVNGEVTTRTIESDSLPTLMRFGRVWVEGETATDNKTDSLLEVLDMNTSGLTSCRSMFRYNKKLTSITCEWNTINVVNMTSMFTHCINLTSLDVSNFNTSNVINMREMFCYCHNLTSLDVSNWNTDNVTDMEQMFRSCQKLASLDVSNWDTSKVTNINGLFFNCTSLTELDVSNWDTSNVVKFSTGYGVFQNTGIRKLDLRNWDIKKADYLWNTFPGSKLEILDISNWDLTDKNIDNIFVNVTTLKYLKCNNINSLNKLVSLLPTKTSDNQGTIICKSDITNLDTTVLQSKNWNILDEPTLIAKYVFDKSIHNNCIPEFNTEFEGYFIEDEVVEGNNEVIRTIESCGMLPTLMKFGSNSTTYIGSSELALLEVLDMNTLALTTMVMMFYNCSNVININCNFNTSKATNMYAMFSNCKKLASLDVSNFNTSNVTTMHTMFNGCNNLTSLDLSNFDTSNVTDIGYMFQYCKKLTSLDLSNFNTSSVTNMRAVFYGCANLTSLDLSNFDTSKVTDTTNMFGNTSLLTDIGVLYMDKSSLQKLVNAMPTDSNKTLWYKDVNIDGITHGNNITLKKYMEGNVEIVLNSLLLEGDTIEVVDGKLCHYHKMGMVVLDGSEDEDWKHWNGCNGTFLYRLENYSTNLKANEVISNTLSSCLYDGVSYGISRGNGYIAIKIDTNTDINIFKQYLQENPTTVVYELETPYYEDITNLQSAPTLKTYLECSMEIDTDLPIDTNVTYRTNLSSVYVMERELDELDNGTDLGDILEGEVNE